jgi:sulfofructose kinase
MPGKPIVVVGHTALDRVYRIDAFPAKPTKVSARDHREEGGGSAANAAAAVAVLGGAVALWSRVGDDDPGAKARRALERSGVDVGGVIACEGAKTPTAAVIVDGKGERLVVSEDDHVLPMEADWLPLAKISDAGAVLSDLTWLEGTRAAFAAARAAGVPTLVDVDLGGGILLERVVDLTDYAIFSAPALEAFVAGTDDDTRLDALIGMGLRHAGVTRGAAGYLWKTRGGERGAQASFKVPVVDTTGAGDAFHGVFALGVASGLTDAECALAASAAAALKCRRLGARAGLPGALELDAFLLEQTGRGVPAGLA